MAERTKGFVVMRRSRVDDLNRFFKSYLSAASRILADVQRRNHSFVRHNCLFANVYFYRITCIDRDGNLMMNTPFEGFKVQVLTFSQSVSLSFVRWGLFNKSL